VADEMLQQLAELGDLHREQHENGVEISTRMTIVLSIVASRVAQ
jgi:hypothetical protein